MVTAELVEFLSRYVDIHVGTRDASLRPHSARASAIRPEDDQHVVVYLPELGADAALEDLEDNGQIAIFVGRPPDNHAYQIKGTVTSVRTADPDERPFVESHWGSFLDSMAMIGVIRPTFDHWPVWPSRALTVRVTAVFSQTPGPGAGASIA